MVVTISQDVLGALASRDALILLSHLALSCTRAPIVTVTITANSVSKILYVNGVTTDALPLARHATPVFHLAALNIARASMTMDVKFATTCEVVVGAKMSNNAVTFTPRPTVCSRTFATLRHLLLPPLRVVSTVVLSLVACS